jgi:hypothetical protein
LTADFDMTDDFGRIFKLIGLAKAFFGVVAKDLVSTLEII